MTYRFHISVLLCSITLNSPAQKLHEYAQSFLQTLTPELKAEAQFEWEDPERYHMNYVPATREGPTFHDFNEMQKTAALALLKASLSENGYIKAREIMELERVLVIMENNRYRMPDGRMMRDPLNYHFCIFGSPSPDGIWGWRFEGHHISLNFSSASAKLVSSTPSFFGANPGVVQIEEQYGKEVLSRESDLGFRLVHSLSGEQLKMAIFAEKAPSDIITGNQRRVSGVDTKGISYAALSAAQKELFMELLEVYVGNYIFEFSEVFMARIVKAGLDNLHFAWAGGLDDGSGHYYRIHGPMLLIEFDNTQNNANHVHTVVRDLSNDFAEDVLSRHYSDEHK